MIDVYLNGFCYVVVYGHGGKISIKTTPNLKVQTRTIGKKNAYISHTQLKHLCQWEL